MNGAKRSSGFLDKLVNFFEDEEDPFLPEEEEQPQEKPRELSPVWYYWIFAASGFAGLIYESIWARYLKLFLGHAAYAQALVLAIFLLGLALGAAWCARLSHKLERPLLGYVAIEILVALTAVYFHDIFTLAQHWAVTSVLPGIESDTAAEVFKWTLAAALIFPQSVLLGATFPLMSAGLLRLWPERRGHLVAMLYFSNSLGAVFGVLASGYILIPFLGLPGTITVAGFINVGAAAAVWALGHLFTDTAAPLAAGNDGDGSAPAKRARLVLAVAFGTGLASFIYEIIWVRMLSLLMGSSTHTFEIMLAAFILGLALGSVLVRKRANSGENLLAALGAVQVAMGILALWSLFCFPLFYGILNLYLDDLPRTDANYWIYTALKLGLAMLMMLPATICAGMTLPLLTRFLMDSGGEGAIGKVYAANTLGAIVGVFIALHILLPLAGIHAGILIAAAVDIGIGIALVALVLRARLRWAAGAGAAALAVAALFGGINVQIATAGVFRYQKNALPNVIFYQDGKTASIAVTEIQSEGEPYSTRALRTNGKPDASVVSGGNAAEHGYTSDDHTMIIAGLLPLLYKADAKRVMNIGFGSGMTSRTLLLSPHLTQLDNVEIEPAIIAGARHLGSRVAPVFDDPRNKFIFNDAKTVLARAPYKYDIIVSEPSNPWVSGVSNLFTREFYARVRDTLKEDGIFVQWLPLYETTPGAFASVFTALASVFDDIHAYSASSHDVIFIASAGAPLPARSGAALRADALRAFIAGYHLQDAKDLNVLSLGNKESLLPYFESFAVPTNSDYFPYLEAQSEPALFHNTLYSLRSATMLPVPVSEFLGNPPTAGNVAPSPNSAAMIKAATAHRAHANRHDPQGTIQLALAKLASLPCPLPVQEGKDHTAYLQVISELTTILMPMLTKAQMADIWQLLRQDACMAALLEDEESIAGNYTQFWRATSLRDGAAMARTADALLPYADPHTQSGQVLALGAMAGHYQIGNYQQVVLTMLDLPVIIPAVHHATRMLSASAAEKL